MFPPVEHTPSPVAYQQHAARRRVSPGDGFGCRAERRFGAPLHDDPGPGAYDARAPAWVARPKSAMARAPAGRPDAPDRVPGPGSYALRRELARADGKRDRVFVSQTKREPQRPHPGPGPGQYDPRIIDGVGAVPPTIHESRFAKFGDWIDHAKAELPPPDACQQIRMAPGKGVTIPKITREGPERDNVPGPDAYNVVHRSLSKKSKNVRTIQATE
jgi:hypothetical protein